MMILFSSCSVEQIDKTIFIPDETDPSLPAYTEWGYNTFGAVYGSRNYFLVSEQIAPCHITYKDNLLHFSLSGILIGDDVMYDEITLSFNFPSDRPIKYADLLILNNRQYDLVAFGDCIVKMTRSGRDEKTLNVVSGNLYFKRAQLLLIDDVPDRIILSGTFELSFLENGSSVSISKGRFDMGINNIYAY